jgi:hypothetical protein
MKKEMGGGSKCTASGAQGRMSLCVHVDRKKTKALEELVLWRKWDQVTGFPYDISIHGCNKYV